MMLDGCFCQMDVLVGVPSDEMSADKLCDLSAWRVTIPKIRMKPEPDNPRKHVFVFCIEVHRVDITEGMSAVHFLQVDVVVVVIVVVVVTYLSDNACIGRQMP